MRQFIRHPSDIPFEYHIENTHSEHQNLRNISEGGFSFITNEKLEVGALISITIKLLQPNVSLQGSIVWNNSLKSGQYLVGVKFDENEHFRARMVEQVCQIEIYRQQVLEEEGRELSSEKAAIEWIQRYAAQFPG